MTLATANNRSRNREDTLLLAFALLLVVLLYFSTLESVVSIWMLEDHSHGFIVIPICVYLIWQKRAILANTPKSYSRIGFAALFGLSLLWWLSDFAGVQVVSQFAVVGMIPAAVLALFGWTFASQIKFALFYLVFAIPFGDFLIPYLMDFTANFSVAVLNLFGIPVLQDGRFFHVPSGSFEVAKACSGLKFLAATVALTALYSHILFSRVKNALLFILFAIGLSIVANGIRATSIVLLLHFTELDIAAGKDHEFVGWIVFGLMIALLIWTGKRFGAVSRERRVQSNAASSAASSENRAKFSFVAVGVLIVMAIAAGPALNLSASQYVDATELAEIEFPHQLGHRWLAKLDNTTLQPAYTGYSQLSLGTFVSDDVDVIEMAVVCYTSHRQGAEIVSATNSVVDTRVWTINTTNASEIDVSPSISLPLWEVYATTPSGSQLIWHWTEVNGRPTRSKIRTKLAEIRSFLSGVRPVSTEIILAAPGTDSIGDRRRRLRDFLFSFYPPTEWCDNADSLQTRCALGAPITREK